MKENTFRHKNDTPLTAFSLQRLIEGLQEYKLIRELNSKNIKGVIKHYEFKFYEYYIERIRTREKIYRYHYIILMELGNKDLHSLIEEKIQAHSTWTPNECLIIMK